MHTRKDDLIKEGLKAIKQLHRKYKSGEFTDEVNRHKLVEEFGPYVIRSMINQERYLKENKIKDRELIYHCIDSRQLKAFDEIERLSSKIEYYSVDEKLKYIVRRYEDYGQVF